MKTTPQERLALSVVGLLLVLGLGVRFTQSQPYAALNAAEAGEIEAERAPVGSVEEEFARVRRRTLPLAPGERLDPNTADANELQRLPHVGPALAGRIVAHREAHGAFASLEDLEAVSGIGPSILARVAPHIALPSGGGAVQPDRTAPASTSRSPPPPASGAIDINTANATELTKLPGIGPVLAQRIIESRERDGPFASVAELERVSGIGPRTLERIAPHARVRP